MLHQVIREHLEPFLRAAAEAGEGVGLPQLVEREFREFLTCGVLEQSGWPDGIFPSPGDSPRTLGSLRALLSAFGGIDDFHHGLSC